MKVFVAGAAGAVGKRLVPLLVDAGHEVFGTTRWEARAHDLQRVGVRPVLLDVYDAPALTRALLEARPELVIHQLTDLTRLDFAANARVRTEGSRNLVDAAQAAGVRRMVTQSFWGVYVPGEGLADEETPLYVDAPAPWDGVASRRGGRRPTGGSRRTRRSGARSSTWRRIVRSVRGS